MLLCRTIEELRVSSPCRTGMPRRVECFSTFLALDVGFDIRGLKIISEPCRAFHPSLIVRLVSPNLYSKPAPEHATQLCVDLGLIKVSEQICKGYSNFFEPRKPSWSLLTELHANKDLGSISKSSKRAVHCRQSSACYARSALAYSMLFSWRKADDLSMVRKSRSRSLTTFS